MTDPSKVYKIKEPLVIVSLVLLKFRNYVRSSIKGVTHDSPSCLDPQTFNTPFSLNTAQGELTHTTRTYKK